MKKFTTLILLVGAIVALAAAPMNSEAGDLGPQRLDSTISTNNAEVALPIGETGRFTAQYLIFTGLPVSTQEILYVASGYTGTVAAASTDTLVAISNLPTLFFGDKFLVTANGITGTNTATATLIGTVFD